ncbi:MAG: hypothetical protein KatS3mg027_1886 [Bacteroidia bacterium]|nr:MAG: hypothetical protein KatS3mg027_1886 [Bacteroidia bacterium]
MARAILLDNGTELIYNACEFDVVSTNRIDNGNNNESIEPIIMGEEIADISVFAVYPNPASEYIQVEYETQDNLIFEIVDAYGKVVISDILVKEQTKQSIDVSNLPSGIYYYVIEKGGTKLVRDKIVIVR